MGGSRHAGDGGVSHTDDPCPGEDERVGHLTLHETVGMAQPRRSLRQLIFLEQLALEAVHRHPVAPLGLMESIEPISTIEERMTAELTDSPLTPSERRHPPERHRLGRQPWIEEPGKRSVVGPPVEIDGAGGKLAPLLHGPEHRLHAADVVALRLPVGAVARLPVHQRRPVAMEELVTGVGKHEPAVEQPHHPGTPLLEAERVVGQGSEGLQHVERSLRHRHVRPSSDFREFHQIQFLHNVEQSPLFHPLHQLCIVESRKTELIDLISAADGVGFVEEVGGGAGAVAVVEHTVAPGVVLPVCLVEPHPLHAYHVFSFRPFHPLIVGIEGRRDGDGHAIDQSPPPFEPFGMEDSEAELRHHRGREGVPRATRLSSISPDEGCESHVGHHEAGCGGADVRAVVETEGIAHEERIDEAVLFFSVAVDEAVRHRRHRREVLWCVGQQESRLRTCSAEKRELEGIVVVFSVEDDAHGRELPISRGCEGHLR